MYEEKRPLENTHEIYMKECYSCLLYPSEIFKKLTESKGAFKSSRVWRAGWVIIA